MEILTIILLVICGYFTVSAICFLGLMVVAAAKGRQWLVDRTLGASQGFDMFLWRMWPKECILAEIARMPTLK